MKETQTKSRMRSIRLFLTSRWNKFGLFIDKRPLTSFFGLLVALFVIIAVGSFVRKPPAEVEEKAKEPKKVEVFSIGKAPKMAFSGIVEKSGVIKIVAQSPGIVNYINTFEGTRVWKGQVLLGLSSNYVGGSIPTVSRQIAEQSYQLTEQNYPSQLELIAKRREIAEKSDALADQLRDIGSQSIQDTKNQISLNEQILSSLDTQITQLEADNVDGVNNALLLQAKTAKSGVLSGLSALKSALRSVEFTSNSDEEGARISDSNRELTVKQLEIEERSLKLGKEIAQLNLRIAQISESLLYPMAPGAGVIERVYVSPGQSVNPGTVLFTLTTDKNIATIVVNVSTDIARQLSRLEKSTLRIGNDVIELSPRYISTEPTEGQLHSVLFSLTEEQSELLTDGARIQVEMPIGQAKSTASVPYVPIDAIFQTQTSALLYIASSSGVGTYEVKPREVSLGTVFGSYVQIRSGLSEEDQVVLNRDVLSGDIVSF